MGSRWRRFGRPSSPFRVADHQAHQVVSGSDVESGLHSQAGGQAVLEGCVQQAQLDGLLGSGDEVAVLVKQPETTTRSFRLRSPSLRNWIWRTSTLAETETVALSSRDLKNWVCMTTGMSWISSREKKASCDFLFGALGGVRRILSARNSRGAPRWRCPWRAERDLQVMVLAVGLEVLGVEAEHVDDFGAWAARANPASRSLPSTNVPPVLAAVSAMTARAARASWFAHLALSVMVSRLRIFSAGLAGGFSPPGSGRRAC